MPALDPILKPRSVAVVGASRRPGTIGHEVVAALARCGFTGPVYPVNPKAHSICSMRAYPSVADLPEPVDLAVIVVPKELVLGAVTRCADAGVRGLVVISSGFREIGGEGVAREAELTAFVRSRGIRLVGPNCMGVLNADPAVSLNATFYPGMPPFGRAAFVSQSGALGLSVLDYAREYGIGISQFVSMGNKCDVSGNDLLLAWEEDPAVGVILMYVESFGNPRKFLEIASRITRTKPIIVVKSGRSVSGARAASSHTGSLASSDRAVDALLAQAGVIRAETVEELFDYAMVFGTGRLPASRRVGVLTNAGGPGILAADALEAQGMELPDLAPATVERLRPLFPPYASIRNPLDMVASANPEGYRVALTAMLEDPEIDLVLPIFVPPLGLKQEEVTDVIADVAGRYPAKPVTPVLMGHEGLPQGKAELHAAGIPAFIFPESAARAMAMTCRYAERMRRVGTEAAPAALDTARLRRLLDGARDEAVASDGKVSEADALALLAAAGIPVAEAAVVGDAKAAVAFADRVGYPVVLKVVSPDVVHKSDVGGVRTGIGNREELASAYREITASVARALPAARITGMLVQRQVNPGMPGRELIAGISRDPAFGPLVMFGLGGVYVEVLGDVVFRLAPIDRVEALAMVDAIRGRRMLDAVRGQPAVDRAALADVLVRLSRLAWEFQEIEEVDMNPLVVTADGTVIGVDGRVRVGIGNRK